MRALVVLLILAAPAAALEPLKPDAEVAFFGIHFIDTSTEGAYFGAREDEAQRVTMLEGIVAKRFADEGFQLVDLAPVEEELARISNPADCYGCDLRMGQELGADYVLVGEVQKVSNLILAMNLVLREVERRAAVRGLAVDIRSNTDESWRRGMRYILDRHFFAEE
jgi:hypothetical protein